MQLTVQIKLIPEQEQMKLLECILSTYIATVNDMVANIVSQGAIDKRTSADVSALMPSALKNQAIQDARSVFKKYSRDLKAASRFNEKNPLKNQKAVKVPVLKKPVAIWNNQNFSVEDETISFPLWINGKAKKTSIKAVITDRHSVLLQNKLAHFAFPESEESSLLRLRWMSLARVKAVHP